MMSKSNSTSEKGQILVLLAIGMVGLLAFTALAIDGGMVLFDRRSAQNAADAAALAGAFKLANNDKATIDEIKDLAQLRAKDNGYENGTNGTTINVVYPFDPGSRTVSGDPSSAHYVYVSITSTVKTSFVHLIGFGTIKNTVEAVAHMIPPNSTSMFAGSALVALARGGCSDSNKYGDGGVSFSGSNWSNLIGGGIFVNSTRNCSLSAGGSAFVYTPSVKDAAPQMSDPNGKMIIQPGTPQFNNPQLPYPPSSLVSFKAPTCLAGVNAVLSAKASYSHTAYNETTSINYDYELSLPAGATTANFYGDAKGGFPSGKTWINPGIYCFHNAHPNSIFDLSNAQQIGGTNVMIYITGDSPCTFTWNAQSIVKLKGYTKTSATDPNQRFDGLLFYVDPKGYLGPNLPSSSNGTLTFNGDGSAFINGTILAPACTASLNGTGGSMYQGQVIAYNIKISGTQSFNMDYNPDLNAKIPINGTVDLAR
jgi:Flp pilus assembly protein TadG